MADDIAMLNILGERGLRYKRNVLAASLIATVIWLVSRHIVPARFWH